MGSELVAFAAGSLLAWLVGRVRRGVGAWSDEVRAKREAALVRERALQRNEAAEALLKAKGYAVIARDAPAAYAITVDGDPRVVNVAADFLVEHQGKRAIAEVKTGPGAKLETAATRWHFLEQQHAFGVPSVVLVDPDAGAIATIRFPLAKTALTAVPPPLPPQREASLRAQRARKLEAGKARRKLLWKSALALGVCGCLAWWMLHDRPPPRELHELAPSEAKLPKRR